MKKLMFFFCTALLLTSMQTTLAQSAEEMEMMKAWQNFMTPGDKHKMLAKMEGTWTVDVSSWMDPAAAPTKSTATQVNTTLFNGLYQYTELKGTMMGMPFEGRGTTGYDNAKKMFVSTWIDNMGSGIIYMTGTWDEETKTLHLKGTQSDPMTGKDSMIREELKIVDENTHVMTMYGQGMDGKEMKFMEATYQRK